MSKAIVSSLYDSDVFKMACRQFDQAADAISLPDAIRDRTKYPRRCLAVSIPVRRIDGSVTVFEGYRVQHNISTGPSKGGIRFHQDVTLGEVAALAMWMSWKCSLAGLPYGGAKGGVIVNPSNLSESELEHLSRRYPFRAEDMDGLYKKVVKGSYQKIGDNYSKALSSAIKSMLQVNPANRPSASQLLINL